MERHAVKIALALSAIVLVLAALLFQRRQNRAAATGGRISRAKLIWLFFAVYAWFIVPPLLIAGGVKNTALLAFTSWMWIRGAAELYLLYVVKRWKPPIGIAHDLSCIAILACGPRTTYDTFLIATLVAEIVYAFLFYKAVEGRTTGATGVWFADDDPRFLLINRLTATGNIIFIAAMLVFLSQWLS